MRATLKKNNTEHSVIRFFPRGSLFTAASFYLWRTHFSVRLLGCLMPQPQRLGLYSLLVCHYLKPWRKCNIVGQRRRGLHASNDVPPEGCCRADELGRHRINCFALGKALNSNQKKRRRQSTVVYDVFMFLWLHRDLSCHLKHKSLKGQSILTSIANNLFSR